MPILRRYGRKKAAQLQRAFADCDGAYFASIARRISAVASSSSSYCPLDPPDHDDPAVAAAAKHERQQFTTMVTTKTLHFHLVAWKSMIKGLPRHTQGHHRHLPRWLASFRHSSTLAWWQPRNKEPELVFDSSVKKDIVDEEDREPSIFGADKHFDSDGNDDDETCAAQEEYYDARWKANYQLLVEYKQMHGHTSVPETVSMDDKPLGRWVRDQRHRYKRHLRNDPLSYMTTERIDQLNDLGFCWDPFETKWRQRFKEYEQWIRDLEEEEGTTESTTIDRKMPKATQNKSLNAWCRRQKKQWIDKQAGVISALTDERFQLLDQLGFPWESP